MIIVFGGSFDPPHIAHVNIVQCLNTKYPNAHKILIIPNAISPFKKEKSLTKKQTWDLCQISFRNFLDSKIELADIELNKDNTSYTIDSIREIKLKYPKEKLYLSLGEDSLADIKNWYEFSLLDALIERYIILRRKTKSPLPILFPDDFIKTKSEVLSNELWDVSSSKLRKERDPEHSKHWMDANALSYLTDIGWYATIEKH